MTQIVAIGDNVIDVYADLGYGYPGGNAVNVAVAAARANVPARYIGQVGDDAAGAHLCAALSEENVDVSLVRVAPGDTARVLIVTRDGEREFAGSQKGVVYFRPSEADLHALEGATLVHTSCYSGLDADLPALRARAPLSYDFSDQQLPAVTALLQHVSVAVFSRGALNWLDAVSFARQVCRLGPSTVLVTRGSADAVLLTGEHVYRGEVTAAREVTDTLGAGDAFIGRVLAGLALGEHPQYALAQAARSSLATIAEYGGFGHPLTVAALGDRAAPRDVADEPRQAEQ